MKLKSLTIIVLATLIITGSLAPASAETSDGMLQALEDSIRSQTQDAASEDFKLPAAPTVSEPSAPPKPVDRANKNGAAKAIAMAGAAFAMVSCAKLMKDAKEATDPSTKSMLQMMAMQQCNQGMKDMADANKNDENKKSLSFDDTPKISQLTNGQWQSPKAKAKESNLLGSPSSSLPDSNSSPNYDMAPNPAPDPTTKAESPTQLADDLDYDTVSGEPLRTALKSIPDAELKFDESSRTIAASSPATGTGAFLFGGSPGIKPTDTAASKNAVPTEQGENNRRSSSGGEGNADSASESAGGAANKAADPFEGMMSQLFGKPADGNPFAGFGGGAGSGPMESGTSNGADKKVNIFQYASFRYQQAAYQNERVKLSKGKRAIASSSEKSER